MQEEITKYNYFLYTNSYSLSYEHIHRRNNGIIKQFKNLKMLSTQSKKERELIIIPDQPARKSATESESSQHISFESENSSLTSNLATSQVLPKPEYFAPLYEVSKLDISASKLKYANLLKMLTKFGEYPDKYRSLIWRYLLSLPLNKMAYENLLRLGIHPAYQDLRKKYPIESQRLFCRTQRILSALGHWSPFMCEVDYLPGFVFPFVKMLEHDDLVLFETVVAIVMHWCQHWFAAHPQPPVQLLQTVEDVVTHEDPELGTHFRKMGFHPVQYAWPLLQTMFSEVLPKSQWLVAMDHVLSFPQQPQLMFAIAAAYLLQLRSSLMTISSSAQLAASVRRMSPIDIKRLIKKAKELLPQLTGDKCPETYSYQLPISSPGQGAYPVLGGYPKYVVELGSQIRKQVLEREQDIMREKHLLEEMQKHNSHLLKQELRLRQAQEGALQAENERTAQQLAETEVEVLERKSKANREKAKQLAHIKAIETKVAESLSVEEKLRRLQEEQLANLSNQRAALQKQETAERQEFEELKNLEYKATEKVAELMRLRQFEEGNRAMLMEKSLKEKDDITREKQMAERWRREEEENRLRKEQWFRAKESEIAGERQGQMMNLREKQQEIMRKERELEIAKIDHERALRKIAEEQVYAESFQQQAEEEERRSPLGARSSAGVNTRMQSQAQAQSIHDRETEQPRYMEEDKQEQPREEYRVTEKKRPGSDTQQTVKMSVHEVRGSDMKEEPITANGANTSSEPFTFKNTSAPAGLMDDATKKMRATEQLFARPLPERAEMPSQEKSSTGRKENIESQISGGESMGENAGIHSKSRSYPATVDVGDIEERHHRVKQQLEEMERRFPPTGVTNGSEQESGAKDVGSSGITSSDYSSSKGKSPSIEGESPEKGGSSSGASLSGIYV